MQFRRHKEMKHTSRLAAPVTNCQSPRLSSLRQSQYSHPERRVSQTRIPRIEPRLSVDIRILELVDVCFDPLKHVPPPQPKHDLILMISLCRFLVLEELLLLFLIIEPRILRLKRTET